MNAESRTTFHREHEMRFIETELADLRLIELEPIEDNRGFFARTFCREEMANAGLSTEFVQCSTSFNVVKGTIRGIHFQVPPVQECKFVRVTSGAVYDVIIDLRPRSKTYLCWQGFELSAVNRKQLFLPAGFGHGFQTLEDHTEVFYQMDIVFHPATVRAVRYDDPTFGIPWPLENPTLSEKDLKSPLFDRQLHERYYSGESPSAQGEEGC